MSVGTLPRGEDFADKFARGEWAESILLQTIDRQDGLFAFQYGVSRGDALDTKAELDEVKEPGVDSLKRPDILVFREERVDDMSEKAYDLLTEYAEADPDERGKLLPRLEGVGVPSYADMALEAESSKFHLGKRSQGGSLSAYVKDEDFDRLDAWHDRYDVPMFVCQLFYDRAYIIPFTGFRNCADSARDPSTTALGIEHGEIPGIYKEGLQADVERFFYASQLGVFTSMPNVVTRTSTGTQDCDYDWSHYGKLRADESAHFDGGVLSLDQPLLNHTE